MTNRATWQSCSPSSLRLPELGQPEVLTLHVEGASLVMQHWWYRYQWSKHVKAASFQDHSQWNGMKEGGTWCMLQSSVQTPAKTGSQVDVVPSVGWRRFATAFFITLEHIVKLTSCCNAKGATELDFALHPPTIELS